MTGDPLHSLHGTADLAEAVDRRREPEQAPYWTLQYFGYALREPIVIGFPIGLFFAWRYRQRQALLPLAAVAAMVAVFMVGPIFGLPLIGRYVRTPSVLLTLFYGLAVFGWMLLPAGPRAADLDVRRRRHRRALDPVHPLARADAGRHAREPRRARGGLRRPARRRAARRRCSAAFESCGERMSAADHRPMPHLRWWLDAPPFSVEHARGGSEPAAARAAAAARRARDAPLLRRGVPADRAAGGLPRRSTATTPGACSRRRTAPSARA